VHKQEGSLSVNNKKAILRCTSVFEGAWEREGRLTFDRVAESVHAEGDRDEKSENFLSGARRPAHQS